MLAPVPARPSFRRRFATISIVLLGFCLVGLSLAAGLAPGLALAQTCELGSRVSYAGHNLPLNAPLQTSAFTTEDAFPSLQGLVLPTYVTGSGDGSNRLFVVEKPGQIVVFDGVSNATAKRLFLDLGPEVSHNPDLPDGEDGFLGLAFDPEFGNPASPHFGEFYVKYNVKSAYCACQNSCSFGCTRVVRFRATKSVGSAWLDTVSQATKQILLELPAPNPTHYGGHLAFGPDDLLYVSNGDGGVSSTAQQLNSLYGKLLRIDVRSGGTYTIPPTNPFVGIPNRSPEIFHYGLRNPWRFSFDRSTGDLWIGDVGEHTWEEVDHLAPSTPGGVNFGHDPCEGTHQPGTTNACTFSSQRPVLEYPHTLVNSVTGGYVYRGPRLPELLGVYIYADFPTGQIFAWDGFTFDGATGLGVPTLISSLSLPISSFGEGDDGELYFVDFHLTNGRVRRLARAPGSAPFPRLLSQTGLFSNLSSLTPAPGVVEYDVNMPLWSDGASKRRWIALPGTSSIGFDARSAWKFPVGTALIKHFDLATGPSQTRRLETRVMLNQTGGWLGFTYRWRPDQSDADLLERRVVESIDVASGQQTWIYPSPADCLTCHTAVSGRILGARAAQLNGPGPLTGNQLRAFECVGLFTTAVGDPLAYDAHPTLSSPTASAQRRARSYLDVNCAICHQPGGNTPATMDLRASTLLGSMNAIGVNPSLGGLGLSSPKIIAPGSTAQSVLWNRMQSTNSAVRMPPVSLVPHSQAVGVVGTWIGSGLGILDSDEDGVADASDNCAAVQNASQLNSDGDALGDACDPDLAAELQATPTGPGAIAFGDTHPGMIASVANTGVAAARGTVVTFYASLDASFDPAQDPLVGDCVTSTIANAGVGGCVDNDTHLPAAYVSPTGSGRIYLAACADAYNVVFEGNEANNCVLGPTPILLPEPGLVATLPILLPALFALSRRSRDRARRRSGSDPSPSLRDG